MSKSSNMVTFPREKIRLGDTSFCKNGQKQFQKGMLCIHNKIARRTLIVMISDFAVFYSMN